MSMARFSSESFSSARGRLSVAAAIGLGSILREHQKILPGRANALLGLSLARTRAASPAPIDSSATTQLAANSSNSSANDPRDLDFKEEDIWDMRSSSDAFENRPPSEVGFRESAGFRHSYASPDQEHNSLGFLPDSGSRSSNRLSYASEEQQSAASQISIFAIPQAESRLHRDDMSYVQHQSAPVNVPDWSKILRKEESAASKKIHGLLAENDEEEDDGDEERMPPHELIAKERSQSQLFTFSVCEGHGRTLKGRDMSRVRNAVWSQMGFAD